MIPADDDREIPVSQILLAHKDSSGQVSYFSTIIRDISLYARHEEGLRKALRRLAEANNELQEFAYICSHDLTEPLRTISGYLELFNRRYGDGLDDKARKYIVRAGQGARRLEQLLADLLRYTRLGEKNSNIEWIDMNEVVDTVLRQLHNKVSEKQAVVKRDDLPELMASESQMVLVLQNLIGNALKFCRDELPRIKVSAHRRRSEWVFAVDDNGIGIDSQFKERIFRIFQRLHPRDDYPGTGIGLSLCQKIVSRQGGRIWFESEIDRGTTFYFSIPVETKGAERGMG